MRKGTMIHRSGYAALLALMVSAVGGVGDAVAETIGMAKDWQIGMQPASSPVAERIHAMHDMLNVIIIAITLLVLGILAYVIFRFSAKRNPHPSKTAHNTLIEVIWTAVPVAILVVIAIPSIKLLYFEAQTTNYDMTLKVSGRQWYWNYTYPDNGNFAFDSVPVQDGDLKPGEPRLLTVDNPVVVPVGATVQVLTTSDDVIHNWAVPSLGLKKDVTPGRVNETWFRADHEGTYYGQCSELCGVNHYFMPIEVHALPKADFDAWVEKAKEQFATNGPSPVRLVANGSQDAAR